MRPVLMPYLLNGLSGLRIELRIALLACGSIPAVSHRWLDGAIVGARIA